MDPAAAIGLAASVITFIDFALRIFSTGSEIASSASGATEHNNELNKVYTTFKDFVSRLEPTQTSMSTHDDSYKNGSHSWNTFEIRKRMTEHSAALQQVATECRIICDQMLNALERLRVQKNTKFRYLKSLRAALETVLTAKRIKELEERLKRFQTLIALHFFPLLRSVFFSRLFTQYC